MYKTLFLPKLLILSFCVSFIFSQNSFSQKYASGAQITNYRSDIDDSDQPYGLYLPKNYDSKKKYPLVIMLHGGGSNHVLAMKRLFGVANNTLGSDVELSRSFEKQPITKNVDYIVVSPYGRGTMGYQNVAEQDVLDVLNDVKKRFSVDENRQYLTGYSMGGGGSLWIGLNYPHYWAAIAAVCPSAAPRTVGLEGNINLIPLKMFQGDEDPVVKKDSTLKWNERFKNVGANIQYQEYAGVSHNSWENAYANGQIFDWFKGKVRNPFPNKISFATHDLKHDTAYWLKVVEKTPGQLASIKAEIKSDYLVVINTKNVQSFEIDYENHPKLKYITNYTFEIDGQKINGSDCVMGKGQFLLENGKWITYNYVKVDLTKSKNNEGPIAMALASRHIYVYGTADIPKPEELQKRISIANQAANWSEYRGDFLGRVMVFPRVVADKDLRPSDYENANLILFGNKSNNLAIQKIDYIDLPIQLEHSVSNIGIVYVMKGIKPDKLIVVSEGLPWWTAPVGATMSRFNTPAAMNSAMKLKDFLVFKNDNTQVLAEGYFDNNWQLNEIDKTKLKTIQGIKIPNE